MNTTSMTPALDPASLYFGENGRCFCGRLRCAGSSAHFTGVDLHGDAVEIIPAGIDFGVTLKCEGCHQGQS